MPSSPAASPSARFVQLTGAETLFMVMNSGSGRRNCEATQQAIRAACAEAGRQCELIVVGRGADLPGAAARAVRMARQASGVVVAVGGDGTLNAVCQAVVGQGIPFGVLPQGTFNYFGRTHGISQDTEQAVHELLSARLEYVSLGRVNDRYFLVNASLGLYPRLLEDRELYKQRFGRSRWVALLSALVTLARAHRQLDIQLDHGGRHQRLRTPTLVVCNNPLQLQQIGIDPEPADDRDHLIALASRPVGTGALYLLLLQGMLSRMGEAENVISICFENMTTHLGNRPRWVKVAVDGEILRMRTPLQFSIEQQVLPLLIPRTAEPLEHP